MRSVAVALVPRRCARGAGPTPTTPRDFIDDAKLFYRVVACGGTDPLPARPRRRRPSTSTAPRWRSATSTSREKYVEPARDVLRRRCGRRACRRRSSIRSAAATSARRSSRIPTRARSRRSRSSTPAIRPGSRTLDEGAAARPRSSNYRDAVDGPAHAQRLDEREHAQARERRHPRPAVVPHHGHDGAWATSRCR